MQHIALATAVRSVKIVGGVRAGQRVLVQADASCSGGMQLQVATALGARVAVSARGEARIVFACALGADLVVNTCTSDVVDVVKTWTGGRGVDVVIANSAGEELARSIAAARAMGTIVTHGFAAGPEVLLDEQKQLLGSMGAAPEDLAWGIEQVRAGKIRLLAEGG